MCVCVCVCVCVYLVLFYIMTLSCYSDKRHHEGVLRVAACDYICVHVHVCVTISTECYRDVKLILFGVCDRLFNINGMFFLATIIPNQNSQDVKYERFLNWTR